MHDGSLWSHADFDGSAMERETKRISRGVETCTGRAAWLREHGSNFFAIESFLSPSMISHNLCSDLFATVMLFREPLARLHSHLGSMLLYHFPYLEETLQSVPEAAGRRYNVTALAPEYPLVFNNYVTRMLCGPAVVALPLGARFDPIQTHKACEA